MHKTFHIVSLGCAKNTVDTEGMAQLLSAAGYRRVKTPGRAQALIVNTCGFIAPAREESYAVLREMAAKKRPGQRLIAAGCLTQREGEAVKAQVNGIDGVIGTRQWMDIVSLLESLEKKANPCSLPEANLNNTRAVSISGASAYLKIADGCRRPCAFCAIPLIKGATLSRPVNDILADAAYLQDNGVLEINLIAQDTTDYGYDMGMRNGLATLLRQLTETVPRVPWLRILYAYPGYVTDELINIMSTSPQILHYLDIPLQHAHPEVLRRMRRPADTDWVRRTLKKMRRALPGLAIRTTFIVGYPGETEVEFQSLLDFLEEIRFDRVGVFTYSPEVGTPGASLGDPVPDAIKEERRQRLMAMQQQISREKNRRFLGKTLDVLIEGAGQGVSIGRSYRDAPEIDGVVLVKGELVPDKIVPVCITETMDYDLSGVISQ